MRTRDALALAAVLVIVAVAALLLTMGSWGGGGMMGGMMGGGMVGVGIALVLFVVAIVFIVLALAGNTATTPAPVFMPAPPPNAAPPMAPQPTVAPPPPVAVTSDVEAAIVRMLDQDEKLLYLRLRDAGAPVLQKDIVGWGTFSAAKVTRLLDRLEGKGLLVRERYGATNRIRLARPPISGK